MMSTPRTRLKAASRPASSQKYWRSHSSSRTAATGSDNAREINRDNGVPAADTGLIAAVATRDSCGSDAGAAATLGVAAFFDLDFGGIVDKWY